MTLSPRSFTLVFFIITALVLCVFGNAQAARKKIPVAKIKVFEGAVQLKKPHGSFKQISQKSLPLTLYSGDTLITYDGRVELQYLKNQSILRILENSKVRIWDEKARRGKMFREVLTQYGHIYANIVKDPRIKSNFVTPTAMAGMAETEFEIKVDKLSLNSVFYIRQGKLEISAENKTITLAANRFIKLLPGRKPGKPEKYNPGQAPLVPKRKTEPEKKSKSWWEYLWPF
jgi:hypothetical protein